MSSYGFGLKSSDWPRPPGDHNLGGNWICLFPCVLLSVAIWPVPIQGGEHRFLGLTRTLAPALLQQADAEDRTRAELDEILAAPDFRRLRSLAELTPEAPNLPNASWYSRLINWIDDVFSGVNLGSPLVGERTEIVKIVGYAVIALLFAGVVWLIVRAINAFRWRLRERYAPLPAFHEQTLELPPGDIPADEFQRRANEFAQQGLFGEAIAQLLLGSMSRTEQAELIRFRRGLTYRDYVRALRTHPEPMAAFRAMVRLYLPIGFGRRTAAESQYREASEYYSKGFGHPLGLPQADVSSMAIGGSG